MSQQASRQVYILCEDVCCVGLSLIIHQLSSYCFTLTPPPFLCLFHTDLIAGIAGQRPRAMEATIEKEKGQHLSPIVSHDVESSKDTSIDADAMKLAAMGYTQDMKRNYSVWSILGVGFSLTNSWVSNLSIPAPLMY